MNLGSNYFPIRGELDKTPKIKVLAQSILYNFCVHRILATVLISGEFID